MFSRKKYNILHLALKFPLLTLLFIFIFPTFRIVENTWAALCGDGVDPEGAESAGGMGPGALSREGGSQANVGGGVGRWAQTE